MAIDFAILYLTVAAAAVPFFWLVDPAELELVPGGQISRTQVLCGHLGLSALWPVALTVIVWGSIERLMSSGVRSDQLVH